MLGKPRVTSHPKQLYMDKNKFKEFCNQLHVRADEEILEIYERHGVLSPAYRLHRPKEYLELLFKRKHENNQTGGLELSDKFSSLYQFEHGALDRWSHIGFSEHAAAIDKGHPLDQAYDAGQPFIVKPKTGEFRPWKDYEVKLTIDCDGEEILDTQSEAEDYYSPWQAYLLSEANEKHTVHINWLKKLGEGERYAFPKEPVKLSLAEWCRCFEALGKYRLRENLLFEDALDKTGTNILEGEAAEDFYRALTDIAKQTAQNQPYEFWIKFLKVLCELYFGYQDLEKNGLSECVRTDVKSLVDLLMQGFVLDYRQIVKDVGMVVGHLNFRNVPPLERVFPEYEEHIRREVTDLLESGLKHYNGEVSNDLMLNVASVSDIISHSFSIGNETLLVSLIQVNDEYFSPSYFGEESLWSHIRSLSAAIESWSKTLASKDDFFPALDALSNGDFNSCYQLLVNQYGGSPRVHTLPDLMAALGMLSAVALTRGGTPLPWMVFVLKAYLIRNYCAHQTRLSSDLFGTLFTEIYNSLVFVIFYGWKLYQRTLITAPPGGAP